MSDIIKLLERQADWQRRRKALSWAEKVRSVEAIRASLLQIRDGRLSRQTGGSPGADARPANSQ